MLFGLSYGVAMIGMSFFAPPAIIGVLLELIYRHKPKKPLRVIAIILIVIAALGVIATAAVIIWMVQGILQESGAA